ncbi:MAG: hypothetical protein HC819_09685 [Cyclobacteriaceae bacterium]|nr:hypothetical protein [Cyclobacteriaceae bacterium]
MEILLKIIVTPIIIILMSRFTNTIHIRDNKAAVVASIAILVIGFFIGWLLTLIFNIATLGVFWIFGLGIITRTLAYAIVIEIVDKALDGFDTRGFMPSFWLSVVLALAWSVLDMLF